MKRITGLDWPLLALAGCLLALSAGGAIGVTHFDDPLSEGLPIYVPCILILITEFTGVADGRRRRLMPTQSSPEVKVDPRRYFESAEERRGGHAARQPVCIYLEMTNRCNLLCTTCPRTYEELEPPADMSWELFTSIVDQIPDLQRAVLHGVGEPMLVRNLPRMVRYLKGRESWRPSLLFRARQGGAGAVASTSSRTCDDQMHIKCISP